uniref:Putative immediate early ICP-46 n=1 Tax=Erythrocytic necrosis virus TaxID=1543320 RepID=A0A4D6QS65_9VIRU|nr:putative immediate early ICP-46 [Erythrocytic necrosis virus]
MVDSTKLISEIFDDCKFNWGRLATILSFIILAGAVADKSLAFAQLASYCDDFFAQQIIELGGINGFEQFVSRMNR